MLRRRILLEDGIKLIPFEGTDSQLAYINGSKTTASNLRVSASSWSNSGNTVKGQEYHPENGCWVINFENPLVTIPDGSSTNGFMYSTDVTKIISLPSSLEKIGNYAFSNCFSLESVNFEGVENLTSIGNSVFMNCEKLKSLDLGNCIERLTSIGSYFCQSCKGLEKINFMPHTGSFTPSPITELPQWFLAYCPNIKEELYFRMFNNVKRIGNGFFSESSYANQSFYMDQFPDVESIGGSFLFGAFNIRYFYATGVDKLTSIGDNFLANAKVTNGYNFKGLTGLTQIPNYFLAGSNIKDFNSEGLDNVQSIGDQFLGYKNGSFPPHNFEQTMEASVLKTADFSHFTKVESIGMYFLAHQVDITSIDLKGFENVKTIKDAFLYRCTSLEYLDMRALKNVTSVAKTFLTECNNLRTLKAYNIPQEIGSSSNLRDLYLYSDTVLTNLETVLPTVSSSLVIHVPESLLSDYNSRYQSSSSKVRNKFVAMTEEELNS